MEKFRTCTKCKIEKPLTSEFFGFQKKNWAKLHTQCKECKTAYLKKWNADKVAERDIDYKRKKHMYEIKVSTKEEVQERMEQAYKQIYLEAFNKELSDKKLKKLMNDDS